MAKSSILTGKQMLLVDDEPDVLDTLEELLPMCNIMRATQFKTAKDCLETLYFDITILDIMGVQGHELLEIAIERNITAVMLTAHALSPDNIIKSYQKGAAAYLPKEKMVDIASFLEDILKAKEQKKDLWTSWYGRMASFFEKKFGRGWQKDEKNFQ